MQRSKISYSLITTVAIIFAGITLLNDFLSYRSFCYHTYDLGIYMEAVKKFSLSNLNPFLTTFGFNFLNDHWHPILFITRIPGLIFPLSFSMFLTEVLFALAAALLPVYILVKNKKLSIGAGSVLVFFMLVNEHILEAVMGVPGHPAVWADFPLLLIVSLIILNDKEKYNFLIIFLAIVLSAFGEQFSFSALGLALTFILTEPKKKNGYILLALSIPLAWFCISGREAFLGPIMHQTGRVSLSLDVIREKYPWNLAQFKSVLIFFLSISPIFYFILKYKWRTKDYKILILILGVFSPLILGRLLAGAMGQQYTPAIVCFVGALGMSFMRNIEISPRAIKICLLIFFLFSFSKFERAFNVITERRLEACIETNGNSRSINESRISELNNAIEQIKNSSHGKPVNVLALGNLVPNLVSDINGNVASICGGPAPYIEQFDWIISERGACGITWPWSREKFASYLQTLSQKYEVVKRTDCLLLIKGPVRGSEIPVL